LRQIKAAIEKSSIVPLPNEAGGDLGRTAQLLGNLGDYGLGRSRISVKTAMNSNPARSVISNTTAKPTATTSGRHGNIEDEPSLGSLDGRMSQLRWCQSDRSVLWPNQDLEHDEAKHEFGIEDEPHDAEEDRDRAAGMTLLRIMSWRLRTSLAVKLLRLSARLPKLAIPIAPWMFKRQ
jgi:hypothetical protein